MLLFSSTVQSTISNQQFVTTVDLLFVFILILADDKW